MSCSVVKENAIGAKVGGCCICGLKSQKGRPFLSSCSYEHLFGDAFHVENRSGDICCKCVSVVRGWKVEKQCRPEVS